jgi:hypothetical protein
MNTADFYLLRQIARMQNYYVDSSEFTAHDNKVLDVLPEIMLLYAIIVNDHAIYAAAYKRGFKIDTINIDLLTPMFLAQVRKGKAIADIDSGAAAMLETYILCRGSARSQLFAGDDYFTFDRVTMNNAIIMNKCDCVARLLMRDINFAPIKRASVIECRKQCGIIIANEATDVLKIYNNHCHMRAKTIARFRERIIANNIAESRAKSHVATSAPITMDKLRPNGFEYCVGTLLRIFIGAKNNITKWRL